MDEEEEQPPSDLEDFPVPVVSAKEIKSKQQSRQLQPKDYLPTLNEAQRTAVVHPPDGGLQILAGPGSGKTKVLTTRVAYLIQEFGILPHEMVVVTFTNKAANEMKVRLTNLIGAEVVDKIIMGTFHSVCVRFLRKYAKLADLRSNFVITSRDDSMAIVKRLLGNMSWPSRFPDQSAALQKEFNANFIMDFISKEKSLNESVLGYRTRVEQKGYEDPEYTRATLLGDIYEDYQKSLSDDNALDFDDLLVVGLDLVQRNPRIMANIKTVLIDEFQDTNVVQYELVKAIAKAHQSLTIVGDPDQSIYGWRNADVGNLGRMSNEFKPVTQVFLEENYRSTGSILGAALAVVKQDTNRIDKSLKATHAIGLAPVLHQAMNGIEEANYIAKEIKRMIALSGNMLDAGDFAILLRYQALSRNIETSLQKMGISSRMVGGHKFFERKEVQDMLSYLQLSSNPTYTSALVRVINTPKRNIGEKTVKEILKVAKRRKISPFEVCVKVANGSGMLSGVGGTGVTMTKGTKNGIRQFVKVVVAGIKRAEEGDAVADLIDSFLQETHYEEHLERTYGSTESKERLENVEELKAFATTIGADNPIAPVEEVAEEEEEEDLEEVVIPKDEYDSEVEIMEGEEDAEEDREEIIMPSSSQSKGQSPAVANPLQTFLSVSILATDSETEESKADASARKVTISTVHAAKGLEWPVVFIPSCEEGTFPFYRSSEPNQVDEERRLLYVGITRAQALCTMTHCMSRMVGSDIKKQSLSRFLSVSQSYPMFFRSECAELGAKDRADLASVLHRAPVDEEKAKIIIAQYKASLPREEAQPARNNYQAGSLPRSGSGSSYSSQSFSQPSQSQSQGSSSGFSWRNGPGGIPARQSQGPAPVPAGAGFTSALSSYRSASLPATTIVGALGQPLPTSKPFQPPTSTHSSSLPSTSTSSTSASTAGKFSWKNGPGGISGNSTTALKFAPPRWVGPQGSSTASLQNIPPAAVPATTASTSTSAAPPLPPGQAKLSFAPVTTSGVGSLTLPETRSSLINDVVLLNPVVTAPRGNLLESFQQQESAAMEGIKSLGKGKGKGKEDDGVSVTVDMVLSSDPIAEDASQEEEGKRPKRAAAKRCAEGLPKKAPAKRTRTKKSDTS